MTIGAALISSSKEAKPRPRVDAIDLDIRFSKEDHAEQRKKRKEPMVEGECSSLDANSEDLSDSIRLNPNKDFEITPLRKDLTRGVRVGADLPNLAKRQLKACLRGNADFFA